MNKYSWRYRDGEITGVIVAESADDAYNKLFAQRPDLHSDMFEVWLAEEDGQSELSEITFEEAIDLLQWLVWDAAIEMDLKQKLTIWLNSIERKEEGKAQPEPTKPMPIIKGSFTRRQPDGTVKGLEFHGVVDTLMGDIKEAAEIVLEGEMHGNDGKTRVHIFLQ